MPAMAALRDASSASRRSPSNMPSRSRSRGRCNGWEEPVTVYVALLRAINVGGTGKLPMTELKAVCEELGFSDVKTYIQSGNVLFRSDAAEAEVEQRLDDALG